MSEAADTPIRSYAAFFPHYLREHASPACRALHYVGTAGVLLCLLGFVTSGDWRPMLAAPLLGYGCAWIGHAFIERNRPATFAHPFWSLMADHHMAWLALTGQLPARLHAAGAIARR